MSAGTTGARQDCLAASALREIPLHRLTLGCKTDIVSDFTARPEHLQQALDPFNACCREGTTRSEISHSLYQFLSCPLPVTRRVYADGMDRNRVAQRRRRRSVSPAIIRTRQTERRATSLSRVDHESESDRQSSSQAREHAMSWTDSNSTERPDTFTRPTFPRTSGDQLPNTRGEDRRHRSDCLAE